MLYKSVCDVNIPESHFNFWNWNTGMKPAVHFGKPDSNVMLHTLKIFSKWILDFEEFIVANQHLWLLWFCMLLDQALCNYCLWIGVIRPACITCVPRGLLLSGKIDSQMKSLVTHIQPSPKLLIRVTYIWPSWHVQYTHKLGCFGGKKKQKTNKSR